MRRRIPSLATLEAFDAVSRFGTTVRAAEELGRTQSAVSRQITNLEKHTAERLFERSALGLQLTPAGQALFEPTNTALNLLDRAMTRARAQGPGAKRIVLRVWPTFGARWLGSRLMKFPREQIGVDFDLSIGLGLGQEAQLRAFTVDAAIMYGDGQWPGITSYRLLTEELVVVGASHLVARFGADITDYDWLHMDARPGAWRRWLAGNHRSGIAVKPGTKHEVGMLVELASLGMGLAALPSLYVERELSTGMLVAPFGHPVSTGRGYYLCYMAEDASRAEFVAFKDWLLSTCHRDEPVEATV